MIRVLPFVLLLSACGGPSDAELRARAEKLAATADPAITAALADPIMTDRDLLVADNSRRVRIVTGPSQANYPLPGGANAEAFAALRALGGPPRCENGFVSGAAFAAQMPPAFVPADATPVEAAGNDRPGCRARFALFHVAESTAAVAARIGAGASAAGYGAETRVRGTDHVVAGRALDGGPGYYAIASPRGGGGSEVAVIAALP